MKNTSTITTLRELISEIILAERSKKSTPGGGLTKAGALRKLYPGEFAERIKGVVDSAKGDVDKAAHNIDVAPRTLYHYLETVPTLRNVETTADKEEEKKPDEDKDKT